MFCKKCGAEVKEGTKFCRGCGAEIQGGKPVQPAAEKPKKSNKKIVIAAVAGILVAAIAAGAAVWALRDKEELEEKPKKVRKAEETFETPAPTTVPTLTPAPTAGTVVTESLTAMYVVNCDEFITLRLAPSTSAEALAQIPLGARVEYIEGAAEGFYKVRYNGQEGYALAAYLSSSQKSDTARVMHVVDCDEWISLRIAPDTSTRKLTEIPLGAEVEFLEIASNGFYEIRYNGYTGYALAQYLR